MPTLAADIATGHAVASSVLAIAADLEAGNREMVELCARIPGQLGYLVADPNDIDASRDLLRRWGGAPGIVGVKVHTEWSHRHTGSPQIAALFDVLADHGRPVKIHNDGPDWDQHLLRIARDHPRLPIIIAHAGLGHPMVEGARIAAQADNIYAEMSQQLRPARRPSASSSGRSRPSGCCSGRTRRCSTRRSCWAPTRTRRSRPADQDRIYWDNAARLFGVG